MPYQHMQAALDAWDPPAIAPAANYQAAKDAARALRHMVVAGMAFGWSALAPAGGVEGRREVYTYARGDERLRSTVTWGDVGGAAGKPTEILTAYSADGGDTYEDIHRLELSWTAGGEFNGSTATEL